MSKRAIRRHHYARLKEKHRKILLFQWGEDEKFVTPFRLGFAANTPHACSRYCCGNLRRHTGERTLQERRGDDDTDPELW